MLSVHVVGGGEMPAAGLVLSQQRKKGVQFSCFGRTNLGELLFFVSGGDLTSASSSYRGRGGTR